MPEYAVPARRTNLSGLADAWIGVGTADIFYDEDVAYARRLMDAGVPCELYILQGGFHGFDVFNAQIPVVQDFRKSQMSALRKCFLENGHYDRLNSI
jgi:acetyl esterase/lipase